MYDIEIIRSAVNNIMRYFYEFLFFREFEMQSTNIGLYIYMAIVYTPVFLFHLSCENAKKNTRMRYQETIKVLHGWDRAETTELHGDLL